MKLSEMILNSMKAAAEYNISLESKMEYLQELSDSYIKAVSMEEAEAAKKFFSRKVKAKKYFLVLVRVDNVWSLENGFYDKEEAQEEKDCLRSHHKAKDIKILSCVDSQDAITAAIEKLNQSI